MSEEVSPESGEAVPAKPAPSEKRPRSLARNFRWQALFQHTADPVFVLDRRRRLLFVNRAWEELTGVTADRAADLVCRRPASAAPDASTDEVLAHALTPPPEVLQGSAGRVRRLLPGHAQRRTERGESPPQWWEVEFLPLALEGLQGGQFILGRIRPLPSGEAGARRPDTSTVPLPEKVVNLRQKAVQRLSLDDWNSTLPAVRRLVEQVRLAARVAAPVLLIGEAGTGKQTLARLIHHLSPQRERPLAALDCSRLPPASVAGVLFGVGGQPARPTLGAVYLADPGALPRDLQTRLVDLLVRTTAEGVEASGPRILAGCRAAVAEEVRSGRLLEELACSLGTLLLEVPPLRERREDLSVLIDRLLERANAAQETQVRGLRVDARDLLRAYPWPGNLRELYAALCTACRQASGEWITAADLPSAVRLAVRLGEVPGRPAGRSLELDRLLEQTERRLIELALKRARGNKTQAARLLSIPVPRLFRRLKALGMADAEGEGSAGAEGSEEGTEVG
jgi:transcriptional regulator with PAS, ATPase and Fis domain